jgi:hypothetical protein
MYVGLVDRAHTRVKQLIPPVPWDGDQSLATARRDALREPSCGIALARAMCADLATDIEFINFLQY